MRGSLFLVLTVLVISVLSYVLPIPFNFRQLELFDPSVYGSNKIMRSLGDLLINSVLFLWLILFLRSHLRIRQIKIIPSTIVKRYLVLALFAGSMILATLTAGHIIRSLVTDSQISFDVLNFFSLNIYSVTGFIVLCCVAAGYYFLFQLLVFLVSPLVKGQPWILYLILSVAGLLGIGLWPGNSHVYFELLLLVWMQVFVFLLGYNHLTILATRLISSRYIFWIFFFSVSIAIVLFPRTKRRNWRTGKILQKPGDKADPSGGILMNILLTDFKQNYLAANFRRLKMKYKTNS